MKLQQLYSYVRQAIDDYQMIADGDRIAVGISGERFSDTFICIIRITQILSKEI